MRQCDVNDVPDSLLEGGTTASLIALRLGRGQVNALDDAAKLASASARDIDRDAPLASALIKALPGLLGRYISTSEPAGHSRRCCGRGRRIGRPRVVKGDARDLCAALYPSLPRGRHGTCLGLRRGLSHRRGRFGSHGSAKRRRSFYVSRAATPKVPRGFWMIWLRSVPRAWPRARSGRRRCRVPHHEQRRGDGAPCLQSASEWKRGRLFRGGAARS